MARATRGEAARALRPSASTTTGPVNRRRTSRTKSRAAASCPRPGPITSALRCLARATARAAASLSSAPVAVTGKASVISSGRPPATVDSAGAGVATVTSPAPETRAPDAVRMAAPVLPTPPATTSTCPNVPLCAPGFRTPYAFATSLCSASHSEGPLCASAAGGMPMSATARTPTWSEAGGSTCPYLGAAKVTVRSASTAGQPTSPPSEGTPEGMSTATMGRWRRARRSRSMAMACATGPVGA